MSQTDSNAFDYQEQCEAAAQKPCQHCNFFCCICDHNDEPAMLTDNDLLED